VGILDVTPGESLSIVVGAGGAGSGGAAAGGGGVGSSISRGAILLAAGGGGSGGNGNTTGNDGFSGNGGGGLLGTTINGANGGAAWNTTPTAAGNNYVAYLKESASYVGGGYNTNISFSIGNGINLGFFAPPVAILQNTMFGFNTFIQNGRGGNYTGTTASNNAGKPGYVSIIW
jgi:hypothetical protein